MTGPADASALMAKITRTPIVHPTARVRDCTLGDYVEILEAAQLQDSSVGAYSYIQEHVGLLNTHMGRFCSVAAMVRIGAPNHPFARASQHRFTYVPEYYWEELPRDTDFFAARRADACHIGNDVWLGHGAIVLPGNRVGDGAVIAAGAVVTHDVAPYTIVAGVPARAIRPRFPPAISARQALTASFKTSLATCKLSTASSRSYAQPGLILSSCACIQ